LRLEWHFRRPPKCGTAEHISVVVDSAEGFSRGLKGFLRSARLHVRRRDTNIESPSVCLLKIEIDVKRAHQTPGFTVVCHILYVDWMRERRGHRRGNTTRDDVRQVGAGNAILHNLWSHAGPGNKLETTRREGLGSTAGKKTVRNREPRAATFATGTNMTGVILMRKSEKCHSDDIYSDCKHR
jgi:hypothetical protein